MTEEIREQERALKKALAEMKQKEAERVAKEAEAARRVEDEKLQKERADRRARNLAEREELGQMSKIDFAKYEEAEKHKRTQAYNTAKQKAEAEEIARQKLFEAERQLEEIK